MGEAAIICPRPL